MASIETDKEKAKIWIATPENIDNDFEETRRCLLSSYQSNIQTHAGYIISLLIGLTVFIATIISTYNTIVKSIGGNIIFSILIIGIVLFIIGLYYMSLRIVFWTRWASVAITIPKDKALDYFNTREVTIPVDKAYNYFSTITPENKDFFYKAPNTGIIQVAIYRQIQFEKDLLPWYRKIALKDWRV
jgi:hypothetical protein